MLSVTLPREHHDDHPGTSPAIVSQTLTPEAAHRLAAIDQALDPLRLRQQLDLLLEALWQHAAFQVPGGKIVGAATTPLAFHLAACGGATDATTTQGQEGARPNRAKRQYRRTPRVDEPRWWRTRPDPFAAVWAEVAACLAASPGRTAKAIFVALQQRYPGQFPDVQLRTLQRRVQVWRADALLTFDDQ